MNYFSTVRRVLLLVSATAFASNTLADFTADMTRYPPDDLSNSGHDVRTFCGDGVEGFDSASATIEVYQKGTKNSRVIVKVENAKPNTLYTLWLRVKGNDQEGNSFGSLPITGGGATPLTASSNLDVLVEQWVGDGTDNPANGFMTNRNGKGRISLNLDFPVEGGAYPFNNISADALALAKEKNESALATPTAIVDPRQDGVDGPFYIRMVSHCQDGLAHGLSPADRETWFEYP